MSYTCSMVTFFFPKKKRFVFVCHHYYYKKVVNYPNFLFVCVFFLQKTSSSEFYWSDQTGFSASMYVDWASMYVDWEKNALHEFEYVYIINVALIMLIQKGHFTHTFKVAICFSSWNRFDPLPHSSGSDITPFLSPYLTLPCPESWFPIALPLSLQQHTHTYIYTHTKYSWGSPAFQIHGLLINVQPLYKTCV